MLNLIYPGTIYNRLYVWNFKNEWEESTKICHSFYKNIMFAYKQIESNEIFLKVVGYTLGIGNVLNGGTPKG
jgi:hypothetical protein